MYFLDLFSPWKKRPEMAPNGARSFFPYYSRPCRHFGQNGFEFRELLFLIFCGPQLSGFPGPQISKFSDFQVPRFPDARCGQLQLERRLGAGARCAAAIRSLHLSRRLPENATLVVSPPGEKHVCWSIFDVHGPSWGQGGFGNDREP